MSMPEFRAETSLYRSPQNYAVVSGSHVAADQVLLATPSDHCRMVCDQCDSGCMKTCQWDCDPGHTWTESCCTATEGCCRGECHDFRRDPNCGACGRNCSASGSTCCDRTCVNLRHNKHNCGKCGHDCGAGTCEDGKCQCPSGAHTCGGTCCSSGQDCFHGCCATNAGGLALKGNLNYLLSSAGCKNIEDLKVSLDVKQELLALNGYSMQLNAITPLSPIVKDNQFLLEACQALPELCLPSIDQMQYLFAVTGDTVQASIQYWDTTAACCHSNGNCDCTGPEWEQWTTVTSLPPHQIKALEIRLHNDSRGHVTGATFKVTDKEGQSASRTIEVDSGYHFPMAAFQLDVVGPFNSEATEFVLGKGTITYEAKGGLCVQGGLPDECSMRPFSQAHIHTAENSNMTYGPIDSPCCGSQLSQSLRVPGFLV